LLHGNARVWLLVGIWSGALLGVLFRVFWTGAPRWLYTPIYIGLGWFAVFFIPDFVDGADRLSTPIAIATLALVVAGGLLYTLGAVVYGLKKPNPRPAWFGFHEVFHTLTILAFISHYVGVLLATYALR
jgi:hemolysin III